MRSALGKQQLVSQADQLLMRERMQTLFAQAEEALNSAFLLPQLTWRRSGKNAGTANLTANRINLNPVLFCHNRDAFFDEVLPHEVSHIVVHQYYGRVPPHGRQWQWVMQHIFGVRPDTTHNFDLEPLALKTFRYRCQCGPVELTARRHNKVVRLQQQYQCRRCKSVLQRCPQAT